MQPAPLESEFFNFFFPTLSRQKRLCERDWLKSPRHERCWVKGSSLGCIVYNRKHLSPASVLALPM